MEDDFSWPIELAILSNLIAVFSPTLGSRQAKRKNAVLSFGLATNLSCATRSFTCACSEKRQTTRNEKG